MSWKNWNDWEWKDKEEFFSRITPNTSKQTIAEIAIEIASRDTESHEGNKTYRQFNRGEMPEDMTHCWFRQKDGYTTYKAISRFTDNSLCFDTGKESLDALFTYWEVLYHGKWQTVDRMEEK